MYVKLFYYMRLFKRTASLVRLIAEVSKDMVFFLILLMIAVFAFGHWFYLFTNEGFSNPVTEDFYHDGIIFAYKMAFADFESTQNFIETDQPMWKIAFLWAIFLLASVSSKET